MTTHDVHLNEVELSRRLRLSERTLQRWRWKKNKGPPYIKAGGRVLYRLSDVIAWEEANRKSPAEDKQASPPADRDEQTP
jgi:hypothetical protein